MGNLKCQFFFSLFFKSTRWNEIITFRFIVRRIRISRRIEYQISSNNNNNNNNSNNDNNNSSFFETSKRDVIEIKLKSRQKFLSWTNEWVISRFIFNFCYEYRTDFKSNKPYSFIGIISSTITLPWINKFIFAFPILSSFFSIFSSPPPPNESYRFA